MYWQFSKTWHHKVSCSSEISPNIWCQTRAQSPAIPNSICKTLDNLLHCTRYIFLLFFSVFFSYLFSFILIKKAWNNIPFIRIKLDYIDKVHNKVPVTEYVFKNWQIQWVIPCIVIWWKKEKPWPHFDWIKPTNNCKENSVKWTF